MNDMNMANDISTLRLDFRQSHTRCLAHGLHVGVACIEIGTNSFEVVRVRVNTFDPLSVGKKGQI